MFIANVDNLVKSTQTWPRWKLNLNPKFERLSIDIKCLRHSPQVERYEGEGLTWYCPSISANQILTPVAWELPMEHVKFYIAAQSARTSHGWPLFFLTNSANALWYPKAMPKKMCDVHPSCGWGLKLVWSSLGSDMYYRQNQWFVFFQFSS